MNGWSLKNYQTWREGDGRRLKGVRWSEGRRLEEQSECRRKGGRVRVREREGQREREGGLNYPPVAGCLPSLSLSPSLPPSASLNL